MAVRFYSVHTYQVNINVGDAAIHILASQTKHNELEPTDTPDRKVHRAVLIDGGTTVSPVRGELPDAHPNLYDTILDIESKFECQGPKKGGPKGDRPLLQFDGFVVTHWDSDHCGGLMHFILEDILKRVTPITDPSKMKLRRAIYHKTTGEPLSWFYAPSWRHFDTWTYELFPKASKRYIFPSWFVSCKDHKTDCRELPIKAVLYAYTDKYTKVKTAKLLRMCVGKNHLLGRNLFNPEQDQKESEDLDEKLSKTQDIKRLLEINKPENAVVGLNTGAIGPVPGMYCLASNGCVIGSPDEIVRTVTDKNLSSIATAVIWSADANGVQRVSHYMAGDAHSNLESAICNWIALPEDENRRVAVVKLSHHGAGTSSPAYLFERLKPLTVLISAGNHKGHGHPRWEVMLLLQRFFKYGPYNMLNNKRPILVSRYPIYLSTPQYRIGNTSANGAVKMLKITRKLHHKVCDRNPGRVFAHEFLDNYVDADRKTQLTAIYNEIRDVIFNVYAANSQRMAHNKNLETVANHVTVFGITLGYATGCVETRMMGDQNEVRSSYLYNYQGLSIDDALEPPLPELEGHEKRGRTLSIKSVDSWDVLSVDDGSEASDDSLQSQEQRLIRVARTPSFSSDSLSLWAEDEGPYQIIPEGAALPENGIKFGVISAKNPLHPFLNMLWSRCFYLKHQPSDTEKDKVLFEKEDEWFQWLQICLLPTDAEMSMSTTAWPLGETGLPNFESRLNLGEKHVLILETENVHETLGVDKSLAQSLYKQKRMVVFTARFEATPPPPTPPLPLLPTDPQKRQLMGPQKDVQVEWTFAEILSFLQLEDNILYKILGHLRFAPATTTTVDGKKVPARNALWFVSGMEHLTNLRLEFDLVDHLKEFGEWLNPGGDQGKPLLKGFSVNGVALIVRKSWMMQDGSSRKDTKIAADFDAQFEFRLDVTLASVQFAAYLTVEHGIMTLRFQHDQPGESLLTTLFNWIYGAGLELNEDNFEGAQWTNMAMENKFLEAIRPRVFQICLSCNDIGIPTGIINLKLDLQVEVMIGKTNDQKDQALVFFVSFGWSKATRIFLRGCVWCPLPLASDDPKLALPHYEKHLDLVPVLGDKKTLLPTLDLVALAGLKSMPKGIPSTVSLAELEIDAEGIYFRGKLICPEPDKKTPAGKTPVFVIDQLDLEAGFSWGGDKNGSKWLFRLQVDTLLYPNDNTTKDYEGTEGHTENEIGPAQLSGELELSSDHWQVSAGVNTLTGSHLAAFFDEESREGALALLEHLSFEYLDLKYEYTTGEDATGSQFQFDGSMLFGTLRLTVDFQYGEGKWDFIAAVGVNDAQDPRAGVSLGGLLEGILGAKIPELPDAVRDIPIAKPGKADELLRFSCSKVDGPPDEDKKPTKMIVLVASVHLASVSLTFTQWRLSTWKRETPSKRIIKVAVSEIGPIEAPLVGKMDELPIEELAYVWVSDKAATDKSKAGISKGEFDKLIPNLTKKDRLFYKPPKQDPEKIEDDDRVIEAGSHFMVVAKDSQGVPSVMLDHVFGRPKPEPKQASESPERKMIVYRWNNIILPRNDDPNPLPDEASQIENKDVSKAPFKLSVGPLSIENIGLQFDLKKQRLGVVFDASFLMGPIGLALIGFGLSARLGKPKTVDKGEMDEGTGIPISDLEVGLKGLLVSFDRPPVTVAGGFMKEELDGLKCYAGGLIVGFKPWMITAMGMYASVPKDPEHFALFMARNRRSPQLQSGRVYELDEAEEIMQRDDELLALDDHRDIDTFTMVFIIMRVQGPLFSVGFADVSGLTGGVGVNTEMRLPTVETVLSFPFVSPPDAVSDPNASPLSSLRELLKTPQGGQAWFNPREGSFWFAAGLKVTAFQMLSVDAVVVLQLNPDIQLGIYGVAVCDVPTLVSTAKFAHVELGIACTLDIAAGTFKLEAQLSPRSFILHNSCHLTGGMALFSWFAPRVPSSDKEIQALQGDWVLTIGGYHQAYNKPKAYPNPPRLGINWTLSSALRISGEAYFAITPRVCMAGGRLHATLTMGALSAWFDAFLDLLLNFEPFYFKAVGGVSVGIRFSMDLWLVTVHISAEIGATLTVAGPPMAGMVHVDFWVFGFDINFGGGMKGRPEALKLQEFIDLVLKSGTNGSSSGLMFPTMPSIEEERDWVALDGTDEDAFFKRAETEDGKKKTTKPFLFNCTSGLVPATQIPGQKPKSLSPSISVKYEDKDAWTVQPGPFVFSVTCAFPSSSGIVMDERITTNPERKKQVMDEKLFPAEHKNIYAKPMCSGDKAGVEITLTIYQSESNHVQLRRMKKMLRTMEEEEKEGYWKVEPIIKAVPTSIWGQYEQKNDPSLNGNNVKDLLVGNTEASKSTVPLIMGFTIMPPKPVMSKDKLEKFDVVNDTKRNVKTALLPQRQNANESWLPRAPDNPYDPSIDAAQVSPLENPQEPPKNGDEEELERWDNVKKVWENEKNDPENAVKLWASRLQFAEGALSGRRPAKLLRRFTEMVPALPMVAMGVL